MDRAYYENALAMADRHVHQGNLIIASQRRLIARLDHCGNDSTYANDLLVTFLTSQQHHEDDLRRFTGELAKLANQPPQS